jgi:4,4'-diaponeurosporenoate glycosyltransferase
MWAMSGWSVGVVVGGWLAGWWLLWRVPGLDRGSAGDRRGAGGEDVAIVIPARDEAHNVGALLADLAVQTRRPAEIVVVDDGSDDATGVVARGGGAAVVRTEGPPSGWSGKPWACWVGVGATTAPRLIFLDADVRLAPDALARVVSTYDHVGGLLSVQPRHVVGRRVEALSMVANIVALAGTGAFTPQHRDPTMAFGPCLASSRREYAEVGGHAAVADAVAEDVALAGRYRAAGGRVTLRAGRDAVSFRMYPRGLRALVGGWTKNLAVGAGAAPRGAALLAAAWVTATLGSLGLVGGLLAQGVPAAAAAGCTIYVAVAAQMAWMARRVGRFGAWPVILYPVPVIVFVALFAASMARVHVVGSVTWSGRRITVGGRG